MCVSISGLVYHAVLLINARLRGPNSGALGSLFWTGISESALTSIGLRVKAGNDDELQRSVVQSYGQRSAQVPNQIIITPIWVKHGNVWS